MQSDHNNSAYKGISSWLPHKQKKLWLQITVRPKSNDWIQVKRKNKTKIFPKDKSTRDAFSGYTYVISSAALLPASLKLHPRQWGSVTVCSPSSSHHWTCLTADFLFGFGSKCESPAGSGSASPSSPASPAWCRLKTNTCNKNICQCWCTGVIVIVVVSKWLHDISPTSNVAKGVSHQLS